MPKSDLTRVQHMLDSARAIRSFIQDKTRSHLDTDRLLLSGIVRELEILGEAAVSISPSIKSKHEDFPWKQMIGMRNRLIHAYFDIDHDVIWKTVTESMPPLIDRLEALNQSLKKDP